MAERNLAIRLTVLDGGKVKAELREVGETGEKSLKKIELAGQPASKSLLALNAAANDVKGSVVGLTGNLGPLGSALGAIGPVGLAVGAALAVVTLGLKAAFEHAAEAEQSFNRLQAVLRATGNTTGLSGKQIAEFADQIEASTLATAEQVQDAAGVMATFRSVTGETFTRAMTLAQDMSAVFGTDLRGSVTQLGKALENPAEGLTALRRIGILFTDSQKDLIQSLVDTGKQAEAQKVILDALESKVGGAGAGEATGLTGATNRLSDAWGNLLEDIGQTRVVAGAAEGALSGLSYVVEGLRNLIKDDPIGKQLMDAQQDLAEQEERLRRIQNYKPIMPFTDMSPMIDPWQGLAERQGDVEFFTFKDSIYGIRALARTLIAYQDKHDLRTIRQIISRWAPPTENNTNAYVRAVAADTGLDADQPLDMHRFDQLLPLTKAIIHHENGQQPYTDAQLTKALVLAGVEPEKANLQASRTVKGGQTATAATAGLGVVEAIQQTIDPARDALVGLVPYLEVAKWLLLVVTLVGIGIMLWARIDDHRKGLR